MQDVIVASGNPGKLREFGELLAAFGMRARPQREFGVADAEEPYGTFVENALAKARHAARETGRPALADDSGLCVDVLAGAPGVRSARWGGEPSDDARNNAKLVADLRAADPRDDGWAAEYVCVLVHVAHADDPLPSIATGRWRGRVIAVPRGSGGFGYDPHFLLPDLGRTAAELTAEEKHRLGHRGRALRALAALWAEAGDAVPRSTGAPSAAP